MEIGDLLLQAIQNIEQKLSTINSSDPLATVRLMIDLEISCIELASAMTLVDKNVEAPIFDLKMAQSISDYIRLRLGLLPATEVIFDNNGKPWPDQSN